MKCKALALLTATALCAYVALADETGGTAPSRHITLQEAVQLALKHNHNVRIAQYGVDEKQHVKEAAKSSYFPSIRNDTSFMRLTDTQLIQLRQGSLSAPGGTPVPA
jgi:outer membrane protein TolC